MPYPCGHTYDDLQCDRCRRLEGKARFDPRYAELLYRQGYRPRPEESVTLIDCPSCGDGKKTKFKASAAMPAEAVAKIISGPRPTTPWPRGWQSWPGAVEAHRQALHRFADRAAGLEYPADWFDGAGIVMPAGGQARGVYGPDPIPYFLCAYAAAWVLRRRGCLLPIQFWFLGGELETWMKDQAFALGVECVDAQAAGIQRQMRCAGGWQLKIYAVLNCPWRHVLCLDADNVVAANPECLLEDSRYHEHGALFWGDNPNHPTGRLTGVQADAIGMPWLAGELDFDTGQFLVDKERCWAALHVVRHLADHADFWGGFNGDGNVSVWYGDKTDFHVGFRVAKKGYHLQGPFTWDAGGFYRHHDAGGRLLFQHASHGKAKLAAGRPVENMVGAEAAVEAHRFRAVVPFADGTTGCADRLVNPERYFHVGAAHGRQTWLEVVFQNEYRLPNAFAPDDAILDIGANVGAFAYACLKRGSRRVHAVEPFPESAAACRRNLSQFLEAHWQVYESAAWRNDMVTVQRLPLHLEPQHGREHTGGYSLVRNPGAPLVHQTYVQPLDHLIYLAAGDGPLRLLKLDCEGAEYACLFTAKRLDQVQEIAGEWHAGADQEAAGPPPVNGWPPWTPDGLEQFLSSQGFTVEVTGDRGGELGHFFARRSQANG